MEGGMEEFQNTGLSDDKVPTHGHFLNFGYYFYIQVVE
jgi:hypothetical protein